MLRNMKEALVHIVWLLPILAEVPGFYDPVGGSPNETLHSDKKVDLNRVTKAPSLNESTDTEEKVVVTTPNSSSSDCPCANNESQTVPPHVIAMQEAIKNKTHMFSKIHYRATHSKDALWASLVLTGLIVSLIVGVLHTRMWQDQPFVSLKDSQPVKYEQYNRKAEIPVRDMLRGRARSLLRLFSKRRRKRTEPINGLNMENFMYSCDDTVDSAHQALLDSSSDDMWNDSDSEEEVVFRLNKRTGDWEGEAGESLMGGAVRYGRSRDRASTSLLSDLRRESTNSESSEMDVIRFG